MRDFLRDVRLALRRLRRTPGFTVIATLTLALGIGGTTAVFSLVHGVVLKPLAFRDAERLVVVSESLTGPGMKIPSLPASANHFERWRREARSFENMTALRWIGMTLASASGPREVGAAIVTSGFFGTLGAAPRLGRDFTAEDDQPERNRVVVVTDRFWRNELGASPAAVGRPVRLDGEPHEVIGVLPPGFRFPQSGILTAYDAETPLVDVFKPIAFRNRPIHVDYNYAVIARLRPGVAERAALAELNVIEAAIAAQIGERTRLEAVTLPFQGALVGKSRTGLLAALAAVGAVLLIACLNLANLLIARASGRRREMAIRVALGAGRRLLLREAFAESLCLAACGGGAGALLAWLTVEVFLRRVPIPLPRLDEVSVDATVLAFAAGVTLLCAFLFGLAPAWRTARTVPQEALESGRRGAGDGAGGHRLRSLLVGAEAALSALLLVIAGLLVHSFARVMARDTGVTAKNVSVVQVALTPPAYKDNGRCAAAWSALEERVSRIPGVTSAGLISQLPFTREQNIAPMLAKGAPSTPFWERPLVNIRYITPGYFDAAGIRVLAGRVFRADEREAPPVLLSESAARKLWPGGEDPVGREFQFGGEGYVRVGGVVADVPVASLEKDSASVVYQAYWVNPWRRTAIVARSPLEPQALDAALRRAVWDVEPSIPVPAPKAMGRLVSESVSNRRFDLALVALFAATALGLACLGVYGLLSYSVTRRTSEIGLRMALGASAGAVAGQMLRSGMAPVAWGLGAGLAAAAGVTRLVEGMLFGVKTLDTATFAAAPAALGLAALGACLIPALRAARIDPATALREE